MPEKLRNKIIEYFNRDFVSIETISINEGFKKFVVPKNKTIDFLSH